MARLVLVGMCNTAAVSVSVSVSALSLLRQLVSASAGNQQFLSSDTSAATALWEYLVAMWLMQGVREKDRVFESLNFFQKA